MDPGDSLFAFLSADSAILALLGSDGKVRIYPDELPQGTAYPAARYTLIGELDQMASQGPLELTRLRYQIDCYALKTKDARAASRAIRNRLRGHKGAMGDHVVQGVFIENTRTGRESDTEPPLSFASRDYVIWFED